MSKKVLIIYGSTTGMTEMSSEEVENGLLISGISEIERKNVIDASISDLNDYEYIVLGSSTWDFGCLQYDFESFHEELKKQDLKGKSFAVFGTGDKSYGETYCLALKIIEETVRKQGGNIIISNLDIEHDLTDDRLEMIRNWGKELGGKILNA